MFGCTIQALTLLSVQVDNHSSKQRCAPCGYPQTMLVTCYLLHWWPNVSCSSRGNPCSRKVFRSKGNSDFSALGYYMYWTEMMYCKTQTLLATWFCCCPTVTDSKALWHYDVQRMQHLSRTHTCKYSYTHTHKKKKKFSIPVADSEGTSGTVTNHGTTPHPSNFDHVELLHLSACHFEFILHEKLRRI